MTRPPSDRSQGRKPLAPEQRSTVHTIRLTTGLWEKFQRLGGIEWLRKKIQQAREPGGKK